jgi:hypothetical protein
MNKKSDPNKVSFGVVKSFNIQQQSIFKQASKKNSYIRSSSYLKLPSAQIIGTNSEIY